MGSRKVNKLLGLIAAILLTFSLPNLTFSSPAVAASKTEPPPLEGMTYPKARRVILGYGWKPKSGNCNAGTTAGLCKKYPEVGNCSGTGAGYCDMTFTRKRRCLRIITAGGPPGDGAVVLDVIFSAAPCSKNL
jgi:hypothetical protein